MTLQDETVSFDISDSGLFITYETDEGDLTIVDDTEIGHGSLTEPGKTWAKKIKKGDFVTLKANNRVERQDANDQIIIGIATIDARASKGVKTVPDDESGSPYSNVFREVTVECFAQFQREFVRGAGVAPALNQSTIMAVATRNLLDGKGSLTNTNIVTSFTATNIVVLEGYYGKRDI